MIMETKELFVFGCTHSESSLGFCVQVNSNVHPHMHRWVKECVQCGCEVPSVFLIMQLSPKLATQVSSRLSLFFSSFLKTEV